MRSPEERITEVKRRIAKKERQKRLQQYRIAAAFAVAACLVVIVSVSLSCPVFSTGLSRGLPSAMKQRQRFWAAMPHLGIS